MTDTHTGYAHEMLAIVEPVHRDYASRGAERHGITFDEMFHELVAHFLATLPSYDPARGPVFRFAEWQARTVIGRKYWRRWARQVIMPPDRPELDGLTDPSEDPAEIAEQDDLLERLRAGLRELTPKQRHTIDLYFGLSRGVPMGGDAIAATVGRHTSAVNERINGGLRRLALAVGADPERATMSRRATMGRW